MSKRGAHEGSIYQRASDGRWTGAVSLGGLRRKVVYGETRREVAEKMTALLRARQQGLPIATERLSVGGYLETWIAGAKATVRSSTWHRYSALVRKHLIPRLGRFPLARLQPVDCAKAFADMQVGGLSPRSVTQARAVLGRALREAEIAGLVGRNAARLTRAPRTARTEMQTLSGDQARALIEAARDDRLGALYPVALSSGAREGELLALRWSDIGWDRGTITIRRTLQRVPGAPAFAEPKTASSRRTISLGASVIEALRRHRITQAQERLRVGTAWVDNDLVFATGLGTPIDAGNLLMRTHYPLLAKAGLPRIRFHDLRHTAATLLLEAGAHPRVVAERLGHSSPSLTLNVYSHVSPTMQQGATSALERVLGA